MGKREGGETGEKSLGTLVGQDMNVRFWGEVEQNWIFGSVMFELRRFMEDELEIYYRASSRHIAENRNRNNYEI